MIRAGFTGVSQIADSELRSVAEDEFRDWYSELKESMDEDCMPQEEEASCALMCMLMAEMRQRREDCQIRRRTIEVKFYDFVFQAVRRALPREIAGLSAL